MVNYDSEKHILLADIAHKRRIDYETEEYQIFLQKVKECSYLPDDPNARMEIEEVFIPEWPPVERSPLALMMYLGGPGDGGPFAKKPWVGKHFVVKNDFWENKAVRDVARKMVPFEEDLLPHRAAYQWQCPVFNQNEHVLIRKWCDDNEKDIYEFLVPFLQSRPEIKIFPVANPYAEKEEKETGQWSPTRRVFLKKDLKAVEDYFKVPNSIIHVVPSEFQVKKKPEQKLKPTIVPKKRSRPRVEHDAVNEKTDEVLPEPEHNILDEVKIYTPSQVLHALRQKLNRNFRLFGGQTSDSKVTAIKEDAVREFLDTDKTDKMSYVRDLGGRNYDCDNFADSLRSSLNKTYGLNCVGIIWGDKHAWNFFVCIGDMDKDGLDQGPKILFVEPQDDIIVEDFNGMYSMNKRCEVYL